MEKEQSPEPYAHSPPPEQSVWQAADLSDLFDAVEPEVFSEAWFLREVLSPYLDEYPFLREDLVVLARPRDTLNTPLDIPKEFYATGIYSAGDAWAEAERDRQIREILEKAKFELKHEDNFGSQ